MADGDSLVDFITWAVETYPARKYALIMSDHGAGWPGGWMDPAPGGLGRDKVVMAQLFGVDGLWLMELDRALAKARQQTGLDKFELIGFDACLMGQLEVFTAVEPHARYAGVGLGLRWFPGRTDPETTNGWGRIIEAGGRKLH
jgi:hypothetical protein